MNFLKAELWKLFSRKSYILLLLSCCVMICIYGVLGFDEPVEYQYAKSYVKLICTDHIEEQRSSVRSQIQTLEEVQEYEKYIQYPFANAHREYTASASLKEAYRKYRNSPISLQDDIMLHEKAYTYLSEIADYAQYNAAILAAEDHDVLLQKYAHIDRSNIRAMNYLSFDLFSNQQILCLLLTFIAFISIMQLFHYEYDANMREILFLTKNGKCKTYLSKVIACGIVLFSMTIILSVILFLVYGCKYGFPDFAFNVQSSHYFYESPWNITVGTSIIIQMIVSFFFAIIVLSIYMILFACTKNTWHALLGCAGLLVLEILLYMNISPYDTLQVFHTCNLFSWLNISSIYNTSVTITLFRKTLLLSDVFIFVFIISLIGLLTASVVIAKKPYMRKITAWKPKILIGNHTNDFLHEAYKTFWMEKGILAVIVFLCVVGYSYNTFHKATADMNESLIMETYRQYGGALTQEKIHAIEETKRSFDDVEATFLKADKLYKQHKISEEEYNAKEDAYLQSLMPRNQFYVFYEDYQNRIGNYVVYPRGYWAVFALHTQQREIKYTLIATLFLAVVLPGIFIVDQKNDEFYLYDLTVYGKKRRIQKKQVLAISVTIFVFIVIFLGDFLKFRSVYPMDNWQAPLTSIVRIQDADKIPVPFLNSCSIFSYFMILQGIRFISLLFFTYLVLALSRKAKKKTTVLLLIMALIFVPSLLYLIGVPFAQNFTIFDMISGNIYLQGTSSFYKLYFLILLLILLVFAVNRRNA